MDPDQAGAMPRTPAPPPEGGGNPVPQDGLSFQRSLAACYCTLHVVSVASEPEDDAVGQLLDALLRPPTQAQLPSHGLPGIGAAAGCLPGPRGHIPASLASAPRVTGLGADGERQAPRHLSQSGLTRSPRSSGCLTSGRRLRKQGELHGEPGRISDVDMTCLPPARPGTDGGGGADSTLSPTRSSFAP